MSKSARGTRGSRSRPLRAGAVFVALASWLASGATAHSNEAVSVAREGKQPQVAVDASGRVHVVFGSGDAIFHARSDDRGRTFSAATQVGETPALSLGMRRGPRVAAAGKSLVVAAVGGKEGKGRDGDLLAWRSEDDGRSWTGPTRVNSVAGSAREGLHALAGHPDGTAFAAWLDLRNNRTEIWGAASHDGGVTWDPDRLIYQNPERSVCQCCHPSAIFGGDGALHVMWRNDLKQARDMFLTTSRDGGKSFSAAALLGRGHWLLNACPMDGGAIAVTAAGRVETIWMRDASIFSDQPGRPERRLARGVQPWIAANAADTYTVWLDRRPGTLFLRSNSDKSPRVLAKGAVDPVVAAGLTPDAPVVAAWETADGGVAARVIDPAK